MPEIEPWWIVCRANALPAVLTLWPLNFSFYSHEEPLSCLKLIHLTSPRCPDLCKSLLSY